MVSGKMYAPIDIQSAKKVADTVLPGQIYKVNNQEGKEAYFLAFEKPEVSKFNKEIQKGDNVHIKGTFLPVNYISLNVHDKSDCGSPSYKTLTEDSFMKFNRIG